MKRKPLVLDLRNKEGLRGFEITLPAIEQGYYLGEITLNGVSFHVEAIEVTEISMTQTGGCRIIPRCVGGVIIDAVNSVYQSRIDRFDEGEVPSVVKIGRKNFFITIEPFAQ